MKRMAIVTITNGGSNFGNRLQNYALQTVLERLGCSPETIFTANIVRRSVFLSRLRWFVRGIVKRTRRQYYFDRFNKRYIRAARRIRYQTLNDDAFARDGYDAAIAGSDQVWNPEFSFNTDFEFLTFMPQDKRWAYAASFGVDELTSGSLDKTASLLRGMRSISVREDAGGVIVKKLTGLDAAVHIDPSLLLEAADYEMLAAPPPREPPGRYYLTYFLGEVPDEYRTYINESASKLGLPVVAVNELPGSMYFNIGPRHFLYLISHADYVSTDSYHGAVFSIIFHRCFTCFRRRGENDRMGSRLDTLLRITGLEGRQMDDRLSAAAATDPVDYSSVDEALKVERARSLEYLRGIVEQC